MLSNRKATSLKDVLNELIKKMGWEEEYYMSLIIKEWNELVGEKFSQISEPYSLIDGELLVTTDSSVWRSELFIRREILIDKINNMIGKEAVKIVLFR
jgi:predicted nucleic acid-binding Zn ribbon protein